MQSDAAAFAAGTPAASLKAKAGAWSTQEWQYFLGRLPDTLSPMQLADLDKTFALTRTGNSEILFAWLRIAIRHHYEPAMPALERFLTTQGRRKFLRPLYEDLRQPWGNLANGSMLAPCTIRWPPRRPIGSCDSTEFRLIMCPRSGEAGRRRLDSISRHKELR